MERERLRALAVQLGESPAQVARTLVSELERAFAEIDTGIAAGDADGVGRATHAARNSVLMLDDAPMLDGLRALERAVEAGDAGAAQAARARLGVLWERLAGELRATG